ncbi:DUF6873 family GME fold protein [Tepidimicrobium xylanilyticum]|uniref:DUF6873 family GME fold protein n=1 Tax=Tepidimicrobium xylanilyticum TaxID=1123352 RepID=UPI00264B35B2|nr:hypothetical protein [Tepidimicrobium xylanilyticum]GMG96917.1 hypothetical protein EN5CB1_17430 [Tepidimicrobium xylanilyticum]
MKNPFIPLEMANTVIIDGSISEEMKMNLRRLGLNIIPTIPCKDIAEPISYHPDMVIHPINHNTLIIAPNVFDYYEDKLSRLGIKIIKGETKLTKDYPGDIAYNVGRIGDYAVHNFKYTDEKLKYYLKKESVEFIDIKQGYAKCSMAIVDDRAIITADYPIYRELCKRGINVLLIQPGYVTLKGYSYGFIGGATGNLSNEIVIISGNLDGHPDKTVIINFVNKYNKKIYWLSNEKIIDIGTIITLNCQ